LKVEAWCKKALDKNIWERIVKEAKSIRDCGARGRRRPASSSCRGICSVNNVNRRTLRVEVIPRVVL
jgi:hypothetical protein